MARRPESLPFFMVCNLQAEPLLGKSLGLQSIILSVCLLLSLLLLEVEGASYGPVLAFLQEPFQVCDEIMEEG